MKWREERDALQVRFAAALVLADAELSSFLSLNPGLTIGGFTLAKGERNEKEWLPNPRDAYLRCSKRKLRTARLGMSPGFDRVHRIVFVQIMIPKELGDDLVVDVGEEIEASFLTNGADDLEFESAPDLSDGLLEGEHYTAAWSTVYYFDRLRTG